MYYGVYNNTANKQVGQIKKWDVSIPRYGCFNTIFFSLSLIFSLPGPRELTQYTVEDSHFAIQAVNATVSKITVNIILGRKILNVILLNYLPTTLIVSIVFVTTFFKPFFFEAILTVNLTGKL